MTALEPFMNRVRRAVCVPDGETTDSQFMKLLAPAQAAIEGVDSNVRCLPLLVVRLEHWLRYSH